jgi:hypothetical protein
MNPLDTDTSRAAGRFTVIAILVFLAVSLTALATLEAQKEGTDYGIAAWVGNYFAQVGEALGW